MTAKAGVAHQAVDLCLAVKVNVAAFHREPHFSHRRAPRPQSGKSHDGFVRTHFSHPLQHWKRVADVVEQTDAKTDVKLGFRCVVEQIGLQEGAAIAEVLAVGGLFTQPDHHFGNVDADDLTSALAREFERVEGVATANIKEGSTLDRFAIRDGELKALVHVLAEDLIERVGKFRFSMRVDFLERVSFAVPKCSLGLNLVAQI